MPSLKDVKMKIAGVGKTQQITKAMNMVASAKLRGAQSRIERFRPYASKYKAVLTELAGKVEGAAHPLFEVHQEHKTCALIVITSDRGLCGSFNASIIDAAARIVREKQSQGQQIKAICVGRKGRDALRRMEGVEMLDSYGDRMGSLDFALASSVAQTVIHGYETGELDEVYMVYGEFVSMAHQPPRTIQLLPFEKPQTEESEKAPEGPHCEYLYEPAEEQLLGVILPQYLKVQTYRGMLDTSASEHAARMAAMDNATRNCTDLINSLTLLFNKTRQASITSELIDIVGGAEAQNG
ncbi:MAG: F0F1 ATP synthase subunit gamma [Candidatus Desulfovibrio faecigallinarum]|uniref:F0F1 ATP synthase subunit gamma n=1 Tax=Desulfovibrio sp. An276 TaxID=1965618 RepID=UPI000B3A552C|nr:F0F1 ATP synthase subunit gamma [Desulfovibrio sp. An276]MBU3831946.1 F0F1 ATP synthase subunit gamma [Candidatus Desulfovibrio faecigallinarum]OUO53802.1 ATP synthase F1 subunit gamma [Desulfovibrio sp. An276]